MVRVFTAQIGRYHGPDPLDITIKSAEPEGRPFAPDDWQMVMGVKQGRISPETYRAYYTELMRKNYGAHRAAWDALLAREEVTLLCYCPPTFLACHRLILGRDILPQLGATWCGERSAGVAQARR